MAAVVLGMSSCSETWDDNPVVKTHEGIQEAAFLNTPVMQDMPIMITEENRDGSFHLTCSQPPQQRRGLDTRRAGRCQVGRRPAPALYQGLYAPEGLYTPDRG